MIPPSVHHFQVNAIAAALVRRENSLKAAISHRWWPRRSRMRSAAGVTRPHRTASATPVTSRRQFDTGQ